MRDLSQEDQSIKYVKELFAKNSEVQELALASMESTGKAGQAVGALEAKMLQFFIKAHSVKSVVEIGCFAGYSTLWMAEAVDNGKVTTIENNPEHARLAENNFKYYQGDTIIELLEGEASSALEMLSDDGPFDMVFIDANKSGYAKYLDWAENNTRPGSIIIGDNSFLFGRLGLKENELPPKTSVNQWKAMREFNERLSDEEKYISMYIPTSEGMTVAIKR
ncbi:MAG: O-methyltransferase [Bdellovibrionales bacterium]